MAEKGKIKANLGNLLTYIGQLYRNPRDALKEYVSNSIDRWAEVRGSGECINGNCRVSIHLTPHRVIVKSHSQPGQDRDGLKVMMARVAESMKPTIGVPQIGRLAIGIFAFNQIGTKATFYSKRRDGEPTWKLVLTKNSDDYEIEVAPKHEALESPGMDIIITGLTQDPVRPRTALNHQLLLKYLAEWFDYYLREGTLELSIEAKGRVWKVEPPPINLPVVAEGFRFIFIKGDPSRPMRCNFWFDSSSQGRIAVRHQGVVILEDIKRINEIHPGFNELVYASGNLRGVIDADFLNPLPARTGFEMDANWSAFISWLETVEQSIRSEVEEYQLEQEIQRIEEIKDEAKKLAREILEIEPLQQLEFLGGLRRRRRKTTTGEKPILKPTKTTSRRKKSKIRNPELAGFKFNFKEVPLENVWRHSDFVTGTLRVNTRNPNYIERTGKVAKKRLVQYITLLIGKETVAFNDKTGGADDYLEKLLAFLFAMEAKQVS